MKLSKEEIATALDRAIGELAISRMDPIWLQMKGKDVVEAFVGYERTPIARLVYTDNLAPVFMMETKQTPNVETLAEVVALFAKVKALVEKSAKEEAKVNPIIEKTLALLESSYQSIASGYAFDYFVDIIRKLPLSPAGVSVTSGNIRFDFKYNYLEGLELEVATTDKKDDSDLFSLYVKTNEHRSVPRTWLTSNSLSSDTSTVAELTAQAEQQGRLRPILTHLCLDIARIIEAEEEKA